MTDSRETLSSGTDLGTNANGSETVTIGLGRVTSETDDSPTRHDPFANDTEPFTTVTEPPVSNGMGSGAVKVGKVPTGATVSVADEESDVHVEEDEAIEDTGGSQNVCFHFPTVPAVVYSPVGRGSAGFCGVSRNVCFHLV